MQALLFGRRMFAVAAMTLAFLLLVAIPIGYGVTAIVEYAPDVAAHFKDAAAFTIPAPPE
jgi:hypothetical protein